VLAPAPEKQRGSAPVSLDAAFAALFSPLLAKKFAITAKKHPSFAQTTT
jgi:hypothetical protein